MHWKKLHKQELRKWQSISTKVMALSKKMCRTGVDSVCISPIWNKMEARLVLRTLLRMHKSGWEMIRLYFYLGDNIVLGSLKPLVEHFQKSNANAYLALSAVSDPERFGVPVINDKGEITAVIEKPQHPPSQYAVTGVYCYDKSVHEAIAHQLPSERGELEISDTHT